MDIRLQQILEAQLAQAKEQHKAGSEGCQLRSAYEKLTNVSCTKHHLHDSIFYISNDGVLGFRAIKIFNDNDEYRIGPYHETMAEAYTDAICYL